MSLLAIKYKISVEEFNKPRDFNDMADSISRFNMNGQIARFMSLAYSGHFPVPVYCY